VLTVGRAGPPHRDQLTTLLHPEGVTARERRSAKLQTSCVARLPAGAAEGLPKSRRLRPGQLEALKQSLLALTKTPEAMESYLLRAQGQDDAKRRAQCCIEAVQEAAALAAQRGWLATRQ
jgi:hypothetical protein